MKQRKAQYPIDSNILNRWSPRAMSTELMKEDQLMLLFEAARWASSSYNAQSWRFIYVQRGAQEWNKIFNMLVPFNQSWCKNASYLILVVSCNTFPWNNEPSHTHSFDTGAACQNLALQGYINKIVVHGMEGFDYDKVKKEFKIPDGYTVEAMFAVGIPGKIQDLPVELQKREISSDRKPIHEFAFKGEFKG